MMDRQQKLQIALEVLDDLVMRGKGIHSAIKCDVIQAELDAPKRWPCQVASSDYLSITNDEGDEADNIFIQIQGDNCVSISKPHALEASHELARLADDPVVSRAAVVARLKCCHSVMAYIRELEAGNV